ncbi:MAG: peptidoglycan DD-metalloendopeptidase family protein [bacterium]
MKTILILSFLLLSCVQGYTDDISQKKGKLSNITKEIEKKKSKINYLSGQEKNAVHELAKVEIQIKTTADKINLLEKQLTNVQENIGLTQKSVNLTSAQLNRRQQILLKRLTAIYKYRGGDLLGNLLNTDDFTEISKRLYFMSLIAHADTELIEDINNKKNAYLQKKRILQSHHNKLCKIEKSQENFLNKQERLKKNRKRLLTKIQGEKSLYQQQISKLERDSLELKQLIKNLEMRKTHEGRQIVLRGKGDLPWPVKNRKLYRGYGSYKHPKFNAQIVNKGIDILTPQGETVFSVKDGKVVFANWFKGYGMLVMIDHGEGLYSLYAHLSNILVDVGNKVSKGSSIGIVGGPFESEGYNFHFEIRVNGEPDNPLNWLM